MQSLEDLRESIFGELTNLQNISKNSEQEHSVISQKQGMNCDFLTICVLVEFFF